MSNSPLATYTKLSPNFTKYRILDGVKHDIDTVTIHCVVGQLTAREIVNLPRFVNYHPNNGASCNYAVGKDGSIAMCVEEKNRSWCSGGVDAHWNVIYVNGISGRMNDFRAITIEVASDAEHPYAITPKAMAALLDLLVDICRRNPGIGFLRWRGDKSLVGKVKEQNMTVHRWFDNRECPGDYIYNRLGDIAKEVNRRLEEDGAMTKAEVEKLIEASIPVEQVYGTLKDVPPVYQPTIRKLMEKGALVGHAIGDPDDIDDNVLNLNETFCRIMVVLDQMGLFDN